MTDPSVVRAKDSFTFCDKDGNPVVVGRGQTVRIGHPMLKGREDLFEPVTVDFEYKPRTTAAKGK